MKTLSEEMITEKARVEIISAIAIQVHQHTEYPTSEEYTGVCRKLIQRYPFVKDKVGNGIGSWKIQLRQKFRNLRRPESSGTKRSRSEQDEKQDPGELRQPKRAKRPSTFEFEVTEEEEETYEGKLLQLEEEVKKTKPSKRKGASLMKDTFTKRRDWISKDLPTVEEVITKFPPLKKARTLWSELNEMTHGVLPEDIGDQWQMLISKVQRKAGLELDASTGRKKLAEMMKLHEQEESLYTGDVMTEVKEFHTFELLLHLMAPRTKQSILYKFENCSDVSAKAVTVATNHPYIAFIPCDSTVQFCVIAERNVLTTSKYFQSSLSSLVAAYYTFGIEYPTTSKASLIFVENFLFNIKNGKVPDAVTRFMSSIDSIKL